MRLYIYMDIGAGPALLPPRASRESIFERLAAAARMRALSVLAGRWGYVMRTT